MTQYIGRFAPSPTGPLHFGSLVAAVASYCDAKVNGGKWLVRIEDLDKPREVPGAADNILRTLEAFGLHWDDEVVYQSQRAELYEAALADLKQQDLAYPCQCSRKTIQANAMQTGPEGAIYPGTCINNPIQATQNTAWRMKTAGKTITVKDGILDNETQAIDQLFGDFVIKRADQAFAYQLAVVVDDTEQGVTNVVRGADLWQSTSRQMLLQQALGYPTPQYAHVPLIVNEQGQKLSKQTLAKAIASKDASKLIFEVLRLLNQDIPNHIHFKQKSEILECGVKNWQIARLAKQSIERVEI